MEKIIEPKIFRPTVFSYSLYATEFLFKFLLNKSRSKRFLSPFFKVFNSNLNRSRFDAIRVSSLVGNYLETLANKPLTRNDLENLYLAGAITPLFDSFCEIYPKEILRKILNNQFHAHGNPEIDLFAALFNELKKRNQNPLNFELSVNNIFESQLKSKTQKAITDINTIKTITYQKGGNALLFYASCINITFSSVQKQMIFDYGCFIQLLDDVFDIGQDQKEGNHTLATLNLNNIDSLNFELKKQVESNLKIIETEITTFNSKKKFEQIYSLLYTPTLSYLNTLKQAQDQYVLFNQDNILNEKYIWRGWNIKNINHLIRYLVSG